MSAMRYEADIVAANGIHLAYEALGERPDPPVVLIMGLGTQMITWPDALCETVASRGYFVIRFDNRDCGLSSHLQDLEVPRPLSVLFSSSRAPYRIEDMADDVTGLMDALNLSSAHLVGASMGGFVAQAAAIRHPARVRSLSLIMTSSGSWRSGLPRPGVAWRLLRRRPPPGREAVADAVVETFRLIGSPGYPLDETRLRELAGRSYDRAYDPDGYQRQLAAVLAQGGRTRALHSLAVPAVVLHGMDDPLIPVRGGRRLARAIPGARFVGFPGMGHDLPEALWPRLAEEICAAAAAGEERRCRPS